MNYFGMFFSFMIPGILLGAIAAAAVNESRRERSRRERGPAQAVQAAHKQLYVHSMRDDAA